MKSLLRVSEREKNNPQKPVNTSVIRNPIRLTTNMFSAETAKSEENRKIAVNSRVPKPAKVIGINPAVLAIGNRSRK